ncbi:TonB-dependent receptor plug domain-containing protein, partial [bacterium]|nr:TonB-dependent receptor plug domain-containing protein [bacterium]
MRSIYKPQSLLSLGFFVVVSLFGTPALCHSEPGEESSVHTRDPSLILFAQDDIRLEEITVTSETEHQSKADSSAFATIIKPEKFSKQFKTLPELLSQTPGLNIREHGGLGQLSTLSIRGSSAEQVTVLIDGVRINTPTGGSVDFSAIPLDNVDRIEIIRGGGSAKFGSDAIGGVVNIVTKKPSKKRALNFKLTGGSFYTFKTMESWSEKFDKSSIVLSHSHFSSEGNYKFKSSGTDLAGSATISGQTFKRENSSFFSESLLTKLNHDFNPDLHLNFTNDSFFARRELPGPESETTQLAPTNPLEAKELIATNLTAFTIKKDGALTPSTDFEFGVDNYFSWNDFNDKSPAIGSEIDRNSYNDSVGGHTILSHYLDHKYVDQILTTRSDLKYYYFNDGSDISSTQLIGKKDRFIYSTYLQDEFSILNDKINFTPVVRFEHASDRN